MRNTIQYDFKKFKDYQIHYSDRDPDVITFPDDAPAGSFARVQKRKWLLWINWQDKKIWIRLSNRTNDWTLYNPSSTPALPTVTYGTTIPSGTAIIGSVYIQTSTGNNTGILMNTYVYDGSLWYNTSQVINLTRAQLLTLRNASQLRQSQHYLITDHVQGRLVAGTTILVHATADNEISENVTVNTTYDNEGWTGVYDLDRAILLELKDNRGNLVKDFNGIAISNFDWGNAVYTGCSIDNGTWTVTIGSVRTMTNVKVNRNCFFNTSGMIGGSLTNVELDRQSSAQMTGASCTLNNWLIDNLGNVNLNNYTGGNTMTGYTLNGGSLNYSGSSSQVTLSNVIIEQGASINHTNVTTGTITGTNLTMSKAATINHNNGAGNLSLNRVQLQMNSQVNHSSGVITIADQIIERSSTITQSGGFATANISLNNGILSRSSTVNNPANTNINMTGTILETNSNITTQLGATGTYTYTDTRLEAQSNITILSTATTGSATIQYTKLTSQSFIQKGSTGVLNCTSLVFDGASRLTHNSGNRNYTLNRISMSELGQIILTGSGIVADSIADTKVASRGVITMNNTGTTGNNVLYGFVEGVSGSLSITGTNTGLSISRFKIFDGTASIANNVIALTSLVDFKVTNLGVITVQNMTVNKSMQSFLAENGSSITVNNPTGVGTLSNIKAANVGTVLINGTTAAATTIEANQGNINVNGSTSIRLLKFMIGTLTTGNFAHTNLVHISPTSRTCTASNNGRSEYIGVVSTLPIV